MGLLVFLTSCAGAPPGADGDDADGDPGADVAATDGAATDGDAALPQPQSFRITCFKGDEVALDLPIVHRRYRAVGGRGEWRYETPDGTRVFGRLGRHLSCQYTPLD